MSFVRSAAVIGGYTMISRVFGFVRDILVARYLGAGMLDDVFQVAFKLPNFFRNLFAEGAMSSAFVPIFSGMEAADGRTAAVNFASKVFTILLVILLIFTVTMQIAMPLVMFILAPGFEKDPEKYRLVITLTRITMPYLLCMSLVSLFGGMLNSIGKFWAMAASPILLNIVMISAIFLLPPYLPSIAHALSWGVFLAGVAQVIAITITLKRSGLMVHFTMPKGDPMVRKMLKNMLPAIIGSGIVQINLLVDTNIATLLPSGSVSLFYFANQLNQLPLAIIGTAMGTAMMPLLSRQMKMQEFEAAHHTQNRALEFALLISLPCAAALFILAEPFISVLFQHGRFTAYDAHESAYVLRALAIGLPAFVMVKVFTPCFFAIQDTKTPVKVAVSCMILNIIFNISLMLAFHHVAGIGLATALSAWINVMLLSTLLHKRGLYSPDRLFKAHLPRIMLCVLLMGAALWLGNYFLPPLGGHSFSITLFRLMIICTLSSLLYLVSGYFLRAFAKEDLKRFLPSKFRK